MTAGQDPTPADARPVPDTAPGRPGPQDLEPYAVALTIVAGPSGLDPGGLCGSLLITVARECERAGAAVLGHLKCHARFVDGTVRANLTSLRAGVDRAGNLAGRVAPGESLSLDLAVLVYGLSATTIDDLVRVALVQCAPDASVERVHAAESDAGPDHSPGHDNDSSHRHGDAAGLERETTDTTLKETTD